MTQRQGRNNQRPLGPARRDFLLRWPLSLALLVCATLVERPACAERATRPHNRVNSCDVLPCQALGPAAPYPIAAIDGAAAACGEPHWKDARPIDWQRYAQGEYVGHERLPHVPHYRLRVGDQLDIVFRLSRQPLARPYRLDVGDELQIESFTAPELKQSATIQPDGAIVLRMLGPIYAARTTVAQLQQEIERRYEQYYRQPSITVTPLKVDSKLEDLRSSVDLRYGYGGQSRQATVTPEGTIQLPVVGSLPVQGLTLTELKTEMEERFAAAQIASLDITPVLLGRAPRYVYVVGEVPLPGRYELSGPTTVMQAISMAGGWNHGGNVWNTVVFRRGDDWRLLATKLDLRGPLYGHRPTPADEIWVNDSDIVVVPKTRILVAQNVIDLLFSQGVFKVIPFRVNAAYSSFRIATIAPSVPITPNIPVTPHLPIPVPSTQ